jgi:hypothetical protein
VHLMQLTLRFSFVSNEEPTRLRESSTIGKIGEGLLEGLRMCEASTRSSVAGNVIPGGVLHAGAHNVNAREGRVRTSRGLRDLSTRHSLLPSLYTR